MGLTVPQQIAIGICNLILAFGLFLILKGVGTELQWWSPSESSGWVVASERFGAGITILATILVAESIYAEGYVRKAGRSADWISIYILAPSVIVSAIVSAIWMVNLGKIIPDLVNGYAILGLIGAILRLLPFSESPRFHQGNEENKR